MWVGRLEGVAAFWFLLEGVVAHFRVSWCVVGLLLLGVPGWRC